MNKQEYAEYQQSVRDFFRENDINGFSHTGEPFFSWSPCECCGSSLGGDRYTVTAWKFGKSATIKITVCADCLYYEAYGQLDDTAMEEIESVRRVRS